MTSFVVENGRQKYTFSGELLGSSTSKRHHKSRWIDFALYKSDGGQYIISRIGRSTVYHGPGCPVVNRNDNLEVGRPEPQGVPCETCNPDTYSGVLFPEKQRTFAIICQNPEGVLDSLYQWDENNSRYLTRVARELLEDAADVDAEISAAYYDQHVD